MNTDKTLTKKFCEKIDNRDLSYSFTTKKLEEASIDYVINRLLLDSFMVEIDGDRYDITYGKNKKGEIGFVQRCYPNVVSRCSFEVTKDAFTKGKWFIVTDEDLTEEEQKEKLEELEKMKDREELSTRKDWIERILNLLLKTDKQKAHRKSYEEELMNMSREEFVDFLGDLFGGKK
ncbi:hypothetical protein ACSW9O_15420 (plasmid) [Clostridium perfringens]